MGGGRGVELGHLGQGDLCRPAASYHCHVGKSCPQDRLNFFFLENPKCMGSLKVAKQCCDAGETDISVVS